MPNGNIIVRKTVAVPKAERSGRESSSFDLKGGESSEGVSGEGKVGNVRLTLLKISEE